MDDHHYMALALAEAERAFAKQEVPVGAIVVYENKVIARAHNSVQSRRDATAHAELLALQTACQQLQTKYLIGCSLYVTLAPCAMCAAAMYWLQLKELIYGATDEKRGYQLWEQPLLHPKTAVRGGIAAARSKALLQRFFQDRRLLKVKKEFNR